MSNNDYMQTCNMDERTNEEKLRDFIKELEQTIIDLRNINAESVDNLIAANFARAEQAEAITTLQRQLAEANERIDRVSLIIDPYRIECSYGDDIILWAQNFVAEYKTLLFDFKTLSENQNETIAAQRGEIEKLREQLIANQNWLSIFATRRKLTDHDLRIIKRLRDDNGASLTEGGE